MLINLSSRFFALSFFNFSLSSRTHWMYFTISQGDFASSSANTFHSHSR